MYVLSSYAVMQLPFNVKVYVHETHYFQVHCPLFYVCRTVRQDTVTREEVKEVIITIRGTLSVKVTSPFR